jgi:hypothetical protein
MTMNKPTLTRITAFLALSMGLFINSAQAVVTVDSLKRSFAFKQRLIAEEASSKLMELNLGYEKSLNQRARAARSHGDLEQHNVYARELGRFIKVGPTETFSGHRTIAYLQQTYLDRYTRIKMAEARTYMDSFKQFDRTLAEAESRLTNSGRLAEAKRLHMERQSLRETEAHGAALKVLNSAKTLHVSTGAAKLGTLTAFLR